MNKQQATNGRTKESLRRNQGANQVDYCRTQKKEMQNVRPVIGAIKQEGKKARPRNPEDRTKKPGRHARTRSLEGKTKDYNARIRNLEGKTRNPAEKTQKSGRQDQSSALRKEILRGGR